MAGHVVSPFEHSGALLVGGGLLVLCSLQGPPVIKRFTPALSSPRPCGKTGGTPESSGLTSSRPGLGERPGQGQALVNQLPE